MTLYELGVQYRRRCESLTARVQFLREKLASAPDSERVTLLKRINSLYADAERCRDLARRLTAYYMKGEVRFIDETEGINDDQN